MFFFRVHVIAASTTKERTLVFFDTWEFKSFFPRELNERSFAEKATIESGKVLHQLFETKIIKLLTKKANGALKLFRHF